MSVFVRVAAVLVLALGVTAAASVTGPASAQQLCAKHSDVAEQLKSNHAEIPVAVGVSANGGLVQVFSTDSGSTWTMVITMPNGTTCMLASGEAWENLAKLALGPRA